MERWRVTGLCDGIRYEWGEPTECCGCPLVPMWSPEFLTGAHVACECRCHESAKQIHRWR